MEEQNILIKKMPTQLWRDFRAECAKHGLTILPAIIEAVRDWIDKKRVQG